MKPCNLNHAKRQIRQLLVRKLSGKRGTAVKAKLTKAEHIITVIWSRFKIGIYQLQLKHLRWYLTTKINTLKPSSQYRYYLVIREIVCILQKQGWLPRLNGPWVRPDDNQKD
jgi:hypothetical protein